MRAEEGLYDGPSVLGFLLPAPRDDIHGIGPEASAALFIAFSTLFPDEPQSSKVISSGYDTRTTRARTGPKHCTLQQTRRN